MCNHVHLGEVSLHGDNVKVAPSLQATIMETYVLHDNQAQELDHLKGKFSILLTALFFLKAYNQT